MTILSNHLSSVLLYVLTFSNKKKHQTVFSLKPSLSFKLSSSYGILTLVAITACPFLAEPVEALANYSTPEKSGRITYSQSNNQATIVHKIERRTHLNNFAQNNSNPLLTNNQLSFEITLPETVGNQRFTLSNSEFAYKVNQQDLVGGIPFQVNLSDSFNKPLGKSASPELPSLSSSNKYLPNSEKITNHYIWPAEGRFTSGYGQRWGRMHEGIDIAGPIGTPILAANSGKVVFAGWTRGFGKLIKLKHSNGDFTLYAHNNKILVESGEYVDQGEHIAEMGNTGRSTGPHLHFEIHPSEKQKAVDPLAYLPDGEVVQEGDRVYKMGKK